MFFNKRNNNMLRLDRRILRKNDISVLTLDERWNSLFGSFDKNSDIIECEKKIKSLLKEQAAAYDELKKAKKERKSLMDRVLELTKGAFEDECSGAREEMKECQKGIRLASVSIRELEGRLEELPELLRDVNLELLEHTINLVYVRIRRNMDRKKELEHLIRETRERLRSYIDESETLQVDDSSIYAYFHDLLGAEELEKLDEQFLKSQEEF